MNEGPLSEPCSGVYCSEIIMGVKGYLLPKLETGGKTSNGADIPTLGSGHGQNAELSCASQVEGNRCCRMPSGVAAFGYWTSHKIPQWQSDQKRSHLASRVHSFHP